MEDSFILKIEQLIDQGRNLEAKELAFRSKSSGSNSLRLDQLIALSLNRSGAPEAARAHLEPVYERHQDDPETAGILGSIYKELFRKNQDSKYALLSRDTYAKNFSSTKSYYTGINAATMSSIAGRSSQAREIAVQIVSLLNESTTEFWELATLGEAYLLSKNKEKSIECYRRARQVAGKDWGKVISVHQQLWLLNHYAPVPKDILRLFEPPGVVAFIGHMTDHPERSSPRFPASIEDQVKSSIKASIQSLNVSIGYCSIACGADILFAEAMEEATAELHLILPFSKDDFIRTSVGFAGANWVTRFERLLASHPVTYVTRELYDGYDELFAFQSKIIFGLAILRSLSYHSEPSLLTVLSQTDLNKKEGGTRQMLRWWPFPNRHTNINPDMMVASPHLREGDNSYSTEEIATVRRLLYLVFADMSAVNTLDQDKIRKAIEAYKDQGNTPPALFESTDTHVLIGYEGESEAIGYAQMLWNTSAHRGEHSITLSLHAGLVHTGQSNQDQQKEIALIRTIARFAPSGTVCASDHFAALLALNHGKLALSYLGVVEQGSEHRAMYRVTFN